LKIEEFRRLKLRDRYHALQNYGKRIASRYHGGFQCFLYDYYGYYVEVWKPVGINLIQWIEVVNRDEVVDSYLGQFKLDDL